MSQSAYKLQFSRNPLVQIAAIVVVVLVTVGAVFLGAIVLSFFVGLAILAWLGLTIRLWWLRRRMRRSETGRSAQGGEIMDVEYTVVEERTVEHSRHRDSL
jgi:membrane protein implicated in regulation of membrane protease activity